MDIIDVIFYMGFTTIISVLNFLLSYWLLLKEDAGVENLYTIILQKFSFVLFFLTLLPSSLIYFILGLYGSRIQKKRDYDIAVAISKFHTQCPNCPFELNRYRLSFGYDYDHQTWKTEKVEFPTPQEDPTSRIRGIRQTYLEFRDMYQPLYQETIGKKSRHTGKEILTQEDFDDDLWLSAVESHDTFYAREQEST